MKKISADVVLCCSLGDTGKGKITSHLLKNGKYDYCARYGAGANAGHTIYIGDKKIVTHSVPAGVLHGVRSVIGPGCVINPSGLKKEIAYLEDLGFPAKDLLMLDRRAHIVTESHLAEEVAESKVGTTKRGIGPAYRDKVARIGIRVENCAELSDFNIVDIADEFYKQDTNILFEGAQGHFLDIDWGDYPYVTSSTCTVAGAVNCGVPPQAIKNVFGCAKAYDTYVGAKQFQPEGEIFNKLRELGAEFGATTGRPRQCNWLNLDSLITATKLNGVTELIINKTDIMEQLGIWNLYHNKELKSFASKEEFCSFVAKEVKENTFAAKCTFSFSAKEI